MFFGIIFFHISPTYMKSQQQSTNETGKKKLTPVTNNLLAYTYISVYKP